MHVVPVPLNVTTVLSQNDLNPVISTFRSLSKVSPLVPHRTLIPDWHATPTRATILSQSLGGRRNTPAQQTPRTARATRNELYLQGRSYRRRQSDRDAVARQNVWQVLDQSPAAWRVNGGTGKNTNTNLCRCKAFRNALWPTCPKPQGSELASSCLASSSAALPSSSTCHTTPKSDSTGPPNASPHETHAALADKPQTPPPLHIASNRDTVPGSAPADQPYPHRPAAPALASSHSSNARTASYSEIPLAAPTERRKTIRPPRDDPLCQIPKSGSPSPRQKPPP